MNLQNFFCYILLYLNFLDIVFSFLFPRQYFRLSFFILILGDIMGIKRMNLKNKSKQKRRRRWRIFFYSLLIYLGFSYTFYYSMKKSPKISNEEFVNLLVSTGNANILSQYKTTNLVNLTMKFLFHIDFRNPKTILNGSILGDNITKIKNNTKTISLEYNDDYSDMEELKTISDYIQDPNPKSTTDPIVYLYNSHQLENYSSENLDIYGITPNVMMASYVLRENLNKLGISSLVEEANMSDILRKNGWDYSYSYQASRNLMVEKKKTYSSLKYFIDLHRDSVSRNYTLASIHNQNYAKILFVVGKDYATWEGNYRLASQLNGLFDQYYPGLSRGIMLKTGPKVNGVYNQDFDSNTLLIELGGVENTVEEVYHTVSAISDVLAKYIKGEG